MSQSSNFKTRASEALRRRRARKALWSKAKTAAKGITGFAALSAAVVAIVGLLPLAMDAVRPELKEYKILSTLYAGASVNFFDSALGSPAIVRAVPAEKGITERLYVKENYIVQTLASSEGETKLFSVLSCSPDFRPRLGGQITLQDKPLAEQALSGREPEDLYYLMPATVMNTVYFELAHDVSGASHNRGSGYGVNSACGKDLPAQGYVGPLSEAPQAIQDFRARVPANFYVEAWDRPLRHFEQNKSPYYSLVTPLREDLPPGWPTQG